MFQRSSCGIGAAQRASQRLLASVITPLACSFPEKLSHGRPAAGRVGFHEPSSRRSFHSTPSSEFIFRKRFFKKFFRKRHHPTDVPQDPLKMTLFNQWMAPEDLQLPKPGDPIRRIGAGLLDLVISASIGGAVGTAAWYCGDLLGAIDARDAMHTAVQAGLGTGFATWLVRDAFGDGGNRSIGKKIFKLELAYWDGTLASRGHAALRNWYFMALPLMALHPMLEMAGGMVFTFDIASTLLTQDARKVGDYVFGTRVVDERPDREGRQKDLEVTAEVRLLREEVEELLPGYLKASTNPDDQWYEDVQTQVQSNMQLIKGSQAMQRARLTNNASAAGAAGKAATDGTAGGAAAPLAPGSPRLDKAGATPPSELPSLFSSTLSSSSSSSQHASDAATSPSFGSEIDKILGKTTPVDEAEGAKDAKQAKQLTLSSVAAALSAHKKGGK